MIGAYFGGSGLVIDRNRSNPLVDGDTGGVGSGPFQAGIFALFDGRRRRSETVHARSVPNGDPDSSAGCIAAAIARIRGRKGVARAPGGFGCRRLTRIYTSTSSGAVSRNRPNPLVDGGIGGMAGSPSQLGGLLLSQGRRGGAESIHIRRPPNGNGDAASAGFPGTRSGKPVGRSFGGFRGAGLRRSNRLALCGAVKRNRPNPLVDGDATGVGAVPTQG